MTLRRIIAIVIIYLLAAAGWGVLGTATLVRSMEMQEDLGREVAALYGRPLVQDAPRIHLLAADGAARPVPAEATRLRVALDDDPRQKGLIWYPTFRCDFAATWTLGNPEAVERRYRWHFAFPDAAATYDAFAVSVDGADVVEEVDTRAGLSRELVVPPGGERTVSVRYRTRGSEIWRYRPSIGVGRVRGLDCVVTTDFTEVDFGDGSLSPMRQEIGEDGAVLAWEASDLITRQDIAVVVPEKLNPGPVTTRITYFAPVCLGFFFLLIASVTIVRSIPIHPMHYLFVAGGFFAFHLLLSYLVDVLAIHWSFLLAACASLGLTTCYLRTALGERFPTLAALGGQAFFLVLFSYSFLLPGGRTGLTVAVGSVVTLAVLMALTARVDWADFFARPMAERRRRNRSDRSDPDQNGPALSL